MTVQSMEGTMDADEYSLKERIRGLFVLMRIQSLPLTIATLLISYLTVSNNLFTPNALFLVFVGAFGHIGFYIMNEYYDVEYDKMQGKADKPLTSGVVSLSSARLLMYFFIITSVIFSVVMLPFWSLVAFLNSMFYGWLYNSNSKEKHYSLVFLGAWGFFIVLTGALAAGSPSVFTYLYGTLMFVHMILMTIVGDYKDLNSDESSLLKKLACTVYADRNGTPMAYISFRFAFLYSALNLMQSFIIMLVVAVGLFFNGFIYISGVMAVTLILTLLVSATLDDVFSDKVFKPDEIKKKITIYEALSLVTFVFISLAFTEPLFAAVVGMSSVVWGLGWQQLLYGDALFFSS